MRYCQLVIGPAGSGKSTYCTTIQQHMQAMKRPSYVINLDPAAEKFHYTPTIDIRDLISLEDVMEEMELGPNGGLMYCMEYLVENLDWLEEEIDTDWEDEYVIIDCPGQIELYTHSPVIRQLVQCLTDRLHFRVCVVYLLESQFITDASKFFSGTLTAMSAMIQLEVPHINVLSKMDLIEGRPGDATRNKVVIDGEPCASGSKPQQPQDEPPFTDSARAVHPDVPKSGLVQSWTEEEEWERDRRREELELDRYLEPDVALLLDKVNAAGAGGEKWARLNEAIAHLIEDFGMVSFLPLNIHDEDAIERILLQVDIAIQFGEDQEPKDPREWDNETQQQEEAGDGGADDIVEQSWRQALEDG